MQTNKYKVRYTQTFYLDIEEVISYIAFDLQNDIAAENLFCLLEKKINETVLFPKIHEEFSIKNTGSFKWYRISVNNYLAFYTIEDNNIITFRRFLYGKRNFNNLL